MKRLKVTVPWHDGLHLRPAVKLVRISEKFRSMISISCGSISCRSSQHSEHHHFVRNGIDSLVEANGDDEQDAARAVEQVFASDEDENAPDSPDEGSA